MERGGFRGRGGPLRGAGPGRGRGGFNGRGRGVPGMRGAGRGGLSVGRGAGGPPRGRGGVFSPPNHSNVLVVSARGRGGAAEGGRGGMRGAGRGAFRGVAGVPGAETAFRGRGGRGGDRGAMMGRGGVVRGAGGDRGALKRVQPIGGMPSKRGRYDASQPNGYNQYQGYEQATAQDPYGPPAAASVSYGGAQGYNNGSYGGYGGASQTQGYGGQGYGSYGQTQGYDSTASADYSAAGYPSAQDPRYTAQQPDPYGDYYKLSGQYDTESYSAGYSQGAASGYAASGYDDRSGYSAQSYDTSGYGSAQAVQPVQSYGSTAGYGQTRDYSQHRSRY